ncbi:MAG: TolC family protein [Arcobacteraceae bacterium]
MHLKPFSVLTLVLGIASLSLYANDAILSQDRLELFDLSKKQAEEDASKLKKDWINPITYKLSQTQNEEHNPLKSVISVNQPIFKSGGIYQAILYAYSIERYSHLDIDIQKKNMIKDATKLLFEIHKINYTLKKQELLIANADLDILRKREQVLNGIIDTSFLDNAILDANTKKNALAELHHQRNELIHSFNTLASSSYEKFELPEFKLIEDQNYIDNNLNILKVKEDMASKNHLSLMTITKYLPTINFTYDYTKYHDYDNDLEIKDKENRELMGLNLTIPIDFRTSNDIQSSRIDYLKSRISLSNTILEEENFYKTKLSKIEMIESKKNIANEDYKLYNSLLEDITQAANAGLNSFADVETLANSKKIKSFDIQILELERQIELLEIYAKVVQG